MAPEMARKWDGMGLAAEAGRPSHGDEWMPLTAAGPENRAVPQPWLAGGATLITSSRVVRPAATFMAPEMRRGFMPSR